jgi:ParB-like chromosome segregation protein Spo0J
MAKKATKKQAAGSTKKSDPIRSKRESTSSLSSTTTPTTTTTCNNLSKAQESSETFPKSLTSLEIQNWPLHEILPYEKNARKISPQAIQKVAKSLKEFGWRQPMVVDKAGVLIVGHARRLAAVELGWVEGPVHVARDLTPEQIRAYRLMDNRSHQETEWDFDLVGEELKDLAGLDFPLDLTGFNESEIELYVNGPDFAPASEEEQGRLDQKKPCVCPECGHEFVAA